MRANTCVCQHPRCEWGIIGLSQCLIKQHCLWVLHAWISVMVMDLPVVLSHVYSLTRHTLWGFKGQSVTTFPEHRLYVLVYNRCLVKFISCWIFFLIGGTMIWIRGISSLQLRYTYIYIGVKMQKPVMLSVYIIANEPQPWAHCSTFKYLVSACGSSCSALQKPSTFPSSTCIALLWGSFMYAMLTATCCGCIGSCKSIYICYFSHCLMVWESDL